MPSPTGPERETTFLQDDQHHEGVATGMAIGTGQLESSHQPQEGWRQAFLQMMEAWGKGRLHPSLVWLPGPPPAGAGGCWPWTWYQPATGRGRWPGAGPVGGSFPGTFWGLPACPLPTMLTPKPAQPLPHTPALSPCDARCPPSS